MSRTKVTPGEVRVNLDRFPQIYIPFKRVQDVDGLYWHVLIPSEPCNPIILFWDEEMILTDPVVSTQDE